MEICKDSSEEASQSLISMLAERNPVLGDQNKRVVHIILSSVLLETPSN